MAFFCQKTCVYEKKAVLLRPISRSRAVVARQAHNLKVGGSIPSSATRRVHFKHSFLLFQHPIFFAEVALTLRIGYA